MLEELLEMAHAGRLTSLAFMGELDQCTIDGLAGRYCSDPARAVGQLAVMNLKLTGAAARRAEEPFGVPR